MTRDKTKRGDVESLSSRDAPISRRSEDRLGRSPFADALADHIATGNLADGAVVAVMGPWGSGKTSVLNMVRERLAEHAEPVEIVDFNPWYFSGTEQLVAHFFDDIGSRFLETNDASLAAAAGKLKSYGRVVRPLGNVAAFLGALGVPLATVLGELLRRSGDTANDAAAVVELQPKSMATLRSEVREAFEKLDRRVVIVLDDLDRLRADEIRDLVRLVRLVADMPNTVYLLAFDRHRVEQALSEGASDPDTGRHYLEKIIEVAFDLPVPRAAAVSDFLLARLNALVAGKSYGPFAEHDWTNYFVKGLRDMFATPRDVHRYLASLPVVLNLVGDEVALADVLALEAVRVLAPDYFAALPAVVDLLTQTGRSRRIGDRSGDEKAERERYAALLARAGGHREAVAQLNSHLFPATERFDGNAGFSDWQLAAWRRARRVADPDLLRFYLETTLPNEVLPVRLISDIVSKLGDEHALGEALDALSPEQYENVLDRIGLYETEFPEGCAAAAIRVLHNRISRIRRGLRLSGAMPPTWLLWGVSDRLLRTVQDEELRANVVIDVLGSLDSLSARFGLLDTVGYHSEEGRIVAKERLDEAADSLRTAVLNTGGEALAAEHECARLVVFSVRDGEHPKASEMMEHPNLVRALLAGSVSEGRSFAFGDAAGRASYALAFWDQFARIFGADRWIEAVRRLLASPREGLDDETLRALDLAEKYLDGWRPTE